MDPVTAVGLASAILSLVDFGSRVLSKSVEAYKSAEGATRHDGDIAYAVERFQDLNGVLKESLDKAAAAGNSGVAAAMAPTQAQQTMRKLAGECSALSDELLAALRGLQSKSANRVWRSVRMALKSVWNKDKIDAMKAKLDDMKSQMQFGVLVEMSSEIQAMGLVQSDRFNELSDQMQRLVAALALSSQWFMKTLQADRDHLDSQFKDTRSTINFEGQKIRDHIDVSLQKLPAPATALLPQDDREEQKKAWLKALHASLHYKTIDERQETIKPRHRKTFEWIFNETGNFSYSGPNFIKWLREHGGVYWINGKAGSGKSTLMNFIANDDRLRDALATWAGSSEAITASFYFWKSGTGLDKTLGGLLRSVLFQVLESCESLLDHVLGPLFKPAVEPEKFNWSTLKLQGCFERLLHQTQFKICLFIDGLDEFAGDQLEIVEILQQASTNSSTKFCLSSRPWPIFQKAFHSSPGLRIQRLTESDIVAYVQDKLLVQTLGRNNEDFKEDIYRQIVDTIVEKADGVFIWVETVVRSVQRGYFSEDSPELLHARLRELPPEILDLYLPMLMEVEPIYRERQYRILEAMRFAYTDLHLFGFKISSLFIQNIIEVGPTDLTTVDKLPELKSHDNFLEMQRAKAQIEACCMGLIEVDEDGFVYFAHETVMNLLNRRSIGKELQRGLSKHDFDPARAFLRSIIALISKGVKTSNSDFRALESKHVLCDGNVIYWAITLAFTLAHWIERSQNCTEESMLDELQSVATQWYQEALRRVFLQEDDDQMSFQYFASTCWSIVVHDLNMEFGGFSVALPRPRLGRPTYSLKVQMPTDFLGLAAQHNLRHYVDAKLTKGYPYTTKDSSQHKILGKPLRHKFANPSSSDMAGYGRRRETVRLTDDTVGPSIILLQYMRRFWTYNAKADTVRHFIRMIFDNAADPNVRFGTQSAWANCLYTACCGAIFEVKPPFKLESAKVAIQMLLENRADTSLVVWVDMDLQADRTVVARMPALDILFLWLVEYSGRNVDEDEPVLQLIAKSQNMTGSEFMASRAASLAFEARVVTFQLAEDILVDRRVAIDDKAYQRSDIDTFFRAGPESEIVETVVDLSDGWKERRFCGPNATRARVLMGDAWKATLGSPKDDAGTN